MKSLTAVLVVVLAIFAFASTMHIESKTADKDFLIKQKFIFEMLQHIHQDDVCVTKYDQSYYDYKPWEHTSDYNRLELIKHFFELWQHKPMYDDEVFTPLYERHAEYAKGLTRVFYLAKDWNAFTHAVFWARMHVNKHLFVYSLNVASVFRKDLEGVVLPAIYEVLPKLFFDAETIETAQRFKMHGLHTVKKQDNIYNAVIKSNYTNVYGNLNEEHSLAYFLEDIGLNAFYYYYNIEYPYWGGGPPGSELNKDRRGELNLYIHSQLLARYYLERLSNGLGKIPVFNMYEPVESGYFSGLHYYPGVGIPGRDNYYDFYHPGNFKYTKLIELYSHRVDNYIDETKDSYDVAVNKLGNMIQANADSPSKKMYGKLGPLYRQIVNEGPHYGKYGEILPNTLMQYETSLRDPLFYSVVKEIVSHYWHLMATYPEYKSEDFGFPGVKIETVHMPESLTTYFEYFDSDISNAVTVEVPPEKIDDPLVKFGRNSHQDGDSFVIKARQLRLNHKPFEFTLDVTSDKEQKAAVKIFVAPKYDENGKLLPLEKNYKNFFELEHFVVDLVAGKNTIKRNSNDYTWFVKDKTTYLDLYRKVMDATNGDYKFQINMEEADCGFPNRLMLPKGKKSGMSVQFVFIVYPYHAPAVEMFSTFDPVVSCGVGSGSRYVDSLPFGFPFNRPIKHGYYYNVDNIKFHDVKIYRKDQTTNVA